jgi:hypothetical protein
LLNRLPERPDPVDECGQQCTRIPHHPFPSGRTLRTPLLVAAMAWYKLRDALW